MAFEFSLFFFSFAYKIEYALNWEKKNARIFKSRIFLLYIDCFERVKNKQRAFQLLYAKTLNRTQCDFILVSHWRYKTTSRRLPNWIFFSFFLSLHSFHHHHQQQWNEAIGNQRRVIFYSHWHWYGFNVMEIDDLLMKLSCCCCCFDKMKDFRKSFFFPKSSKMKNRFFFLRKNNKSFDLNPCCCVLRKI